MTPLGFTTAGPLIFRLYAVPGSYRPLELRNLFRTAQMGMYEAMAVFAKGNDVVPPVSTTIGQWDDVVTQLSHVFHAAVADLLFTNGKITELV